jgi:putative spermidine/putrescine transport system ATP-binding protein
MSDRIAVFNQGRIEQVGTPAEVYEHPATAFVAGFVGTSNLLTGEAAEKVVGASGTYSIRPEKIRVLDDPDDADARGDADDGHTSAVGTVAEVVYLGDATRFIVDLDAGGRLTALQQNLETGSEEVAAYRGARVRLRWHQRHNFRVAETQ